MLNVSVLTVVMPVYNEDECIEPVVQSWLDALEHELAGDSFKIIVLNDGSRDKTAERLANFASDPRVFVINKPNSGHGPTILQGYRMAAGSSHWVFQVDSDNEMEAHHFHRVWSRREQADAVFGFRDGRIQTLGRRVISIGSRVAVRLLFGRSRVVDVNTPYRLMRAALLAPLVERIPDDTFAPNVLLSGAFSRSTARVENVAIPHQSRATGVVSIVKWKLWKSVFKALRQTIARARLLRSS